MKKIRRQIENIANDGLSLDDARKINFRFEKGRLSSKQAIKLIIGCLGGISHE